MNNTLTPRMIALWMIGIVLCIVTPSLLSKFSDRFDLTSIEVSGDIIILGILIIPLFVFAIFYFIQKEEDRKDEGPTDFV